MHLNLRVFLYYVFISDVSLTSLFWSYTFVVAHAIRENYVNVAHPAVRARSILPQLDTVVRSPNCFGQSIFQLSSYKLYVTQLFPLFWFLLVLLLTVWIHSTWKTVYQTADCQLFSKRLCEWYMFNKIHLTIMHVMNRQRL